MSKLGTSPLVVDDRDLRRAAVWLGKHGFAGVAPTALLATRIAMRRRARAALGIAGVLLVLPYLTAQVWYLTRSHLDAEAAMPRLLTFSAALLAILVIRCLAVWRIGRGERRLAASPPVWTTPPVRIGLRQLLGVRLWFALVLHGGAVALLTAVIITSNSAEIRAQAWVSVTALAVMLALCLIEANCILGLPVVAEDEVSLRADDVLRAEGVNLAVSPLLSLILVTQSGLQASHAWFNLMLMPLLLLAVVDVVLIAAAAGRARRNPRTAVTR
jgi:cytochrome bd-type quinol oxidase subunit 2